MYISHDKWRTPEIPDRFHETGVSSPSGSLIPGILGRDMEKQGIPKTLIALGIVTLLIHLIYIIVSSAPNNETEKSGVSWPRIPWLCSFPSILRTDETLAKKG